MENFETGTSQIGIHCPIILADKDVSQPQCSVLWPMWKSMFRIQDVICRRKDIYSQNTINIQHYESSWER